MDVHVRSWSSYKNQICVPYLDSKLMDHATPNDILENFIDFINNVDGGNRMDRPSTNWKFFNLLQKDRVEKEQHNFIDIGSCSLHIIHGAFKAGAETSGWNMKAILEGVSTILRDTPTRREDYISIIGEERFSLFFCATRWVEDVVVADQLIEIWDGIIKVVRYWEKLPKNKQPASKSFLKVQEDVNDKFAVAKFQYFSFVDTFFKSLLTKYQISWSMLPYLYGDLMKLVRNVLQLCVKYEVIKKCKKALQRNKSFRKITHCEQVKA